MRLLMILVLLFSSCNVLAKRENPERYYQEKWCNEVIGRVEYRLPDGTRVDCLTLTHAYEFDFANKWAEAIGQSLHYSAMTGKRAGIALIVENMEKDYKYVLRVQNIIDKFKLPINLIVVYN